ncbi:MAG: lipopolysaccharide transport periplasmic protein LptA [Geminicoccaceae bacterium]|nr:lipopolysaccharide transport periplasmic protein LptA [Geminicoccaceae bacterium]MCS7266524.1 lipopolysaccharide transport periplasmic protein LptA [Geminicoccaceae bacterium]MCX7630171.1 lipopolysaccharide transport periplasmic protein LptA [Geminicoccaceae bacterium]MDW8123880.1 lipopolysaccharide transport periplasmic protein LptA [Geminicoccaceae bacterium]MDW8340057.1 lipopolysaccharide transport periplasmic protein LptA [Geminicoccaceae bacterium]
MSEPVVRAPCARAALVSVLLFAAPTAAQVGLGGKESRAPIEIVADTLTVRQNERVAIFSGNVDATQGARSLRADELTVYYGEEQGGQAIRRIEAVGRVVVAEPGQVARGDRGTYDPAAGKVTLEGNVVLTRGENVVRGGRLELDLATGVAVVRAARAGGSPEERVRALFLPEQERGRGGAPEGSAGARAPAR